jgi:hypothetical protein
VFVYDRRADTIERVSIAFDGSEANGYGTNPSISADGRFVVFQSDASNLVSGDTNSREDIFVRDRFMSTTDRVSLAFDGAQGTSSSMAPSISGNGLYVAYYSGSSNLVSGDTNGEDDVFVNAIVGAGTPGAHSPVVAPGGEVKFVDFGNSRLGSIHGQKFEDLDGDGVRDADEPGLNDWTIEVVDDQGQIVATTVT